MADMAKGKYAKLKNGDWGIRVEGPAKKGDSVMVTTKAGIQKHEMVDQVLWSGKGFQGEDQTLCSVVRVTPEASPRSAPAQGTGECRECGKPIKPQYTVCYDCRNQQAGNPF